MKNFFIGLGFILFILAIVLVIGLIAAGVGYYYVTRPHEFTEKIKIPLPAEIGGTLPMKLDGVVNIYPTELAADAQVEVKLTPEFINEALPTEDYSILAQETSSTNVASMLGRLEFVEDSAYVTILGRDVEFSAQITGELYVRASRQYQQDEEQPGPGDALPLAASVYFTANSVGITPDWSLGEADLQVVVILDEAVRADWYNRFGSGDEFADLVEALLNQRAQNYIQRLDVTATDMRTPLQELLTRLDAHHKAEMDGLGLEIYAIQEISIDNCPTQLDDGSVVMNLGAKMLVDFEATQDFMLPDLSVSDGPCA